MTDQLNEEIVQVNLRDENLRFVFKKTIVDALAAELKADRENHLKPLIEEWKRSGNKSFSVALPDGVKVANVTLTEGKESVVVEDDTAFFLWVKANFPDEIETVEKPAVVIPATSYEQVKPAALTRLVDSTFEQVGDEFVTEAGEPVPGVKVKPAAEPSQFSVTYDGKDKDRTKRKIFNAYRDGQLSHLVGGGSVLPEIEARP